MMEIGNAVILLRQSLQSQSSFSVLMFKPERFCESMPLIFGLLFAIAFKLEADFMISGICAHLTAPWNEINQVASIDVQGRRSGAGVQYQQNLRFKNAIKNWHSTKMFPTPPHPCDSIYDENFRRTTLWVYGGKSSQSPPLSLSSGCETRNATTAINFPSSTHKQAKNWPDLI